MHITKREGATWLRAFAVLSTFALTIILGIGPAFAQNAYITNRLDGSVSVIATATDTVTATILAVGGGPYGVAVDPDGSKVYIVSQSSGVSVIDTATNTVIATIPITSRPSGVAVSPDGTNVYVTRSSANQVLVIDAASNPPVITATISVGSDPQGIAVTPDGNKVYVAEPGSNDVRVIDTATNTVTTIIPAGQGPEGIAITPDGSKVYVTTFNTGLQVISTASDTVVDSVPGISGLGVAVTPDGSRVYAASGGSVAVIETATNSVIATVPAGGGTVTGVAVTPDGSKAYAADRTHNQVFVISTATNTVIGSPIAVGSDPIAFGLFIQPGEPPLTFSGIPGSKNCHGQSVAALASEFGDINSATAALGFSSVKALQNAIWAFCRAV